MEGPVQVSCPSESEVNCTCKQLSPKKSVVSYEGVPDGQFEKR